jgi:hypothetical protein
MSKKKTPPEKKEAEYGRKNYVSFHHGKSTRKNFRVQKRLASKKLRSKTSELTRHALGMNCNVAATELDEITRTLIKSGLSKKRILKSNVLSLREKVRRKAEKRASRQDWNTERKTDLASRWHLRFEQLLTDDTYSDPSIKNARKFLSAPWLRDFLGNEPICRQKLEAWLKAAEKAARRREQKKIETDAVGIKNGTSEILSS